MTDLIVTTEQGKVRGKSCKDYHGGTYYSFSGIPYAKAPTGPLRFKAPQPPEPYKSILNGTKESYECPSRNIYFRYYVGQEDNCLNLNIYTKESPAQTTQKKPVMFWIHGGGFLYGSNKTEEYGPDYLMTEDIVLVSINYRLGIFGFLCLEEQSLGVPGNAGLKDQVMALKWVQKNIHAFGGDADNVTIFGESAGSASVHYLTLSPTTKGLFHKAIMQSGCSLNLWTRGKPNAIEVAELMGYAERNERDIYAKLCKESQKKIANAQCRVKDTFTADHIRPLTPVIEYPSEDAFLTEDPLEIMKSGRQHQIPMIIGYNSMEGLFFEIIRNMNSNSTKYSDLEANIPYQLKISRGTPTSKELTDIMKQFYFGDEKVSNEKSLNIYKLMTDVQFIYGLQKTIQTVSGTSSSPVYAYKMTLESSLNYFKRFTQITSIYTHIFMIFVTKITGMNNVMNKLIEKLPKYEIEGVAHADDLAYLFRSFISADIAKGSEEDRYIQRFVKLWTNFAKYGNPTPEVDESFNSIIWKPVSKGNLDEYFVIDKDVRMEENQEKDRVEFWQQVFDKYSPK